MVDKAAHRTEPGKFADLKKIAENGRINFKVVTLCSGTESPIFALQLIQEAFYSKFGCELFRFEQLFAAEIVEFKQAFVSRNTGCIVFNDMRELLIGEKEATTAKGPKKPIPLNPTILVAGTSCVDFSTLNVKTQRAFSPKIRGFFADGKVLETLKDVRQAIQDVTSNRDVLLGLGESEQTFFSMLSYVAEHKPWIVILENVLAAPFESAKDQWFKPLGYTAWVGKLDTKDFYVPQTRQRRYLVAFRDEKFSAAETICGSLGEAIKCLTQPASASAADFLLGPNHPLAQIARLELEDKAQRPKLKEKAAWDYSKLRHAATRRSEALGNERPVTQWQENGEAQFYDRLNKIFWETQTQRVKDTIDMNQLRALLSGNSWDLFFKTKVIDLSQNVDRARLIPSFFNVGCITPNGLPFISCDGRVVTGHEALALQGLPLMKIKFSKETQDQLKDLAGNAMSTTVIGAVLYAIFMTSLIDNDGEGSPWRESSGITKDYPNPFVSTSSELAPGPLQLEFMPQYDTTGFVAFSVEKVNNKVSQHRRYCFCNGTDQYSTTRLQICNICAMIRCTNCAGNPVHDYRSYEFRSPEPKPYRVAECEFLQYFPTVITNLLNPEWERDLNKFTNQSTLLLKGAYDTPTNSKATTIFEALAKAKFLYQRFYITEVITLTYTSDDGFELKVVCTGSGIDWFVMLDPYSSHATKVLEDKSRLRKFCGRSQPFMKGTVPHEAHSPLHIKWFMWDFASIEVKAIISVRQDATKGKVIDLALEHANGGELSEMLEGEITGKYLGAPKCDAAESSLFIREEAGAHSQSVRLFKDPTRSGPLMRTDSLFPMSIASWQLMNTASIC
ncbi:uncharacterized protein PG998_012410 [Apiospora kogelbergensis]|uniref:uncharacterized protein n=1 Tax=Apiospora kogelbergensis TaxID=1337665 RepID=UPI0031322215